MGKWGTAQDTTALTTWFQRKADILALAKGRNAIFIALSLSHIHILKKICYCECAFYSPFEKLHNKERFIILKCCLCTKRKLLASFWVSKIALSLSLVKPA